MWKYILSLTILLFSCHVDPKEYRGVYVSKNGNEIILSCNSQFESKKPFLQSNMPKEGAEVSILVNEETYDLCFLVDGVTTSFGKWNPDKRELIIQGVRYKWKKKVTCE